MKRSSASAFLFVAALAGNPLLAACTRLPPVPPAATAPTTATTAPTTAVTAPSTAAAAALVGDPGTPGDAKARVARFGGPVSDARPIALSAVLATPDAYAGRAIVVDGKVRAACTRKGCWMELASSMDKGTPGCRVTFKDYGFFVPINSAGASARVEGELAVRTIPAGEVAHYESEGGAFPGKQPDGTAKEIRIVATGVQLAGLP